MARSLWIVPLAAACSDYDLNRPKDDGEAPIDTGEYQAPEPEEDPDIQVSPNPIDFGGLPKDCPAEPITVTITNIGLADLTVSEVTLEGNGSSAFSFSFEPVTLAHEQASDFELNFTPTAWYDYALTLQVSSNDPDGRADVPVTGSGAEDALYEESFDQTYFEEVDVLWVVDNSCSMAEEVTEVQDHFAYFMDEFLALGLDYHLAVITTDMETPGHSGSIQGRVITASSADPEAEFLEYTDQGSEGSVDEKGFDATEAALTAPLVSTTNAGFLRADAGLSVVVLSDEDDYSSMSAATFSSWFNGLKADPERSSFSAIAGPDGGIFDMCTGTTSSGTIVTATGAAKYHDAIDATGGFHADICTADYSEALQHISLTTAGMTIFFELAYEPTDIVEITVAVDGTSIPNDSGDGWTYDPSDNAITFHGRGIPEPGAHVVVSYPVGGVCP